ncbi:MULTISPECIES: DUF202 domain-containing protein [unclassified Leptolyngbya]|uniref:YidH family protein n=1 Tax=unclassified Leptolyngbya TaxID=2650499 RepID=UPI001684CE9A|nr:MULTISPECIES: DUF202 domain-containing protein [unclassified Leptolyngbya]MBD1910387.1 DUF202 domain-containing protein [Leptolyngbya sp. FACHB-8]MBD2155315.1 DUF202 domain-containing protein [Leptolyngbya sp. FACHB-16]
MSHTFYNLAQAANQCMEVNDSTPTSHSPDLQVELAKERNRLAADRTLLTWIRATISFIGFGFGIDRISTLLHTGSGSFIRLLTPQAVSLFFVALGILTVCLALFDYQGEFNRFRQPAYTYTARFSVGMLIAAILLVINIFVLLSMR